MKVLKVYHLLFVIVFIFVLIFCNFPCSAVIPIVNDASIMPSSNVIKLDTPFYICLDSYIPGSGDVGFHIDYISFDGNNRYFESYEDIDIAELVLKEGLITHSFDKPGKKEILIRGYECYHFSDGGSRTSYDYPGYKLPMLEVFKLEFNSNLTKGSSPLDVNFCCNVSDNVKDLIWDFGDGATATGQNVTHQYHKEGIYSVKITAKTELGGEISKIEPNLIYVDTPFKINQSPSVSSTISSTYGAYSPQFFNIRVVDDLTGVPIQNATVSAMGKKVTNPISWMSQLFGGSWGGNISETPLTGFTDENGVITFAMFPNVCYEVTTSYNNYTKNVTSLYPSSPLGEYSIRLETIKKQDKNANMAVITNGSINGNNITIEYKDSSNTTKSIQFSIYEKNIDGKYVLIQNRSASFQNGSESFQISNQPWKSYFITINADTAQYGTINRCYSTTFSGERVVDIGIPSELYIYLCLGILIIFAASGTIITGPIIGICVCFMGWIMYFMGWMFALGAFAPISLSMATILSILFYIRIRNSEGVIG